MADSQENLVETCHAHEAGSSDQLPLVCENADRSSITSMDEVGSQHGTKSSSVRLSTGGLYQGPHDWRKCLRPIANLDRLGNCTGDRKLKSPDGMRQKDATDMSNVSCDRSVILLLINCSS